MFHKEVKNYNIHIGMIKPLFSAIILSTAFCHELFKKATLLFHLTNKKDLKNCCSFVFMF